MANPALTKEEVERLQKPVRGTSILARQQAKADALKEEREFAAAVKARDGHKCRWPEAHKCLGGPLEAAHVIDRSLGGPSIRSNGWTVCPFLHRRGPDSIHGKELKVEAETPAGADGPLSFHRQTGEFDALGQPIYYCLAVEESPGVIRTGER